MKRGADGRFLRRKAWLVTESRIHEPPWWREQSRVEVEVLGYDGGIIYADADGVICQREFGATYDYERRYRYSIRVEGE